VFVARIGHDVVVGGYSSPEDRGWRAWIAESRAAHRVSAVIAALAGCGLLATVSVIIAVTVRGRPIPGLAAALFAGVPLLIVGQVWMIALIKARQPPRAQTRRARWRAGFDEQVRAVRSPLRFFFGGLDLRVGLVLVGLFFAGWLVAATAFPGLRNGGPAGSGGGCRYRLNQHGSYTCVSKGTYESAVAAEQRLAAGVLLGFFSAHTGVALGRIWERAT
jgi:hypothetical protein